MIIEREGGRNRPRIITGFDLQPIEKRQRRELSDI
jgi:hypothetical protein